MLAFVSLLVLPFVHALTVNSPNTTVSSAGEITVSWTTSAGDPDTFSIELINQGFNRQFAIANNVDASLQSITLALPQLPTGCVYLQSRFFRKESITTNDGVALSLPFSGFPVSHY